MPKKRPLTLHELVKNDDQVYVRNNLDPRGVMFFAVGDGHNVKIPDTRLPWPVTVPGDALKNSYDFNEALLRGAIVLVAPKEALKELDTKRAQVEIRRLTRSKFAGPLVQHIQQVKAESGEQSLMTEEPKAPLAIEKKLIPQVDSDVYPRVIGIIQQLNTGDLSVTEAKEELEAVDDLLKDGSYRYIIAKAEPQTIVEWAKRRLVPKEKKRRPVKKTTRKKKDE